LSGPTWPGSPVDDVAAVSLQFQQQQQQQHHSATDVICVYRQPAHRTIPSLPPFSSPSQRAAQPAWRRLFGRRRFYRSSQPPPVRHCTIPIILRQVNSSPCYFRRVCHLALALSGG